MADVSLSRFGRTVLVIAGLLLAVLLAFLVVRPFLFGDTVKESDPFSSVSDSVLQDKSLQSDPSVQSIVDEADDNANTDDISMVSEDIGPPAKTIDDLSAFTQQGRQFVYPDFEIFEDELFSGGRAPLMVALPMGRFQLGSPENEIGHVPNEGPLVDVTMNKQVAISRFEITVSQMALFLERTSYAVPDGCNVYSDKRWRLRIDGSMRSNGYRQGPDHPATCVDWEMARAYAAWLSEQTGQTFRLPTEAEWEYAARAGTQTPFAFGTNADEGCEYMNGADAFALTLLPELLNVDCDDGAGYTSPVGQYKPNAFGLHDMHGNVWELTIDHWHESHLGAPQNGGQREQRITNKRVIRGGAWISYPLFLRSANRSNIDKKVRRSDVGLRLVREIEESSLQGSP